MRDGILSRLRRGSAEVRQRGVPHGQRIYAIGDIHGCDQLLDTLLEQIRQDVAGYSGTVTLVYLGDYIDRGLGTARVLDRVCQKPDWAHDVVPLRGNHEEMILQFIDDPVAAGSWCQYGGLETLAAYDVALENVRRGRGVAEARDALVERMPAAHLDFLCSLKLSAHMGDVFFCHAGVRPRIDLAHQKAGDLLWIREEFLNATDDFGAYIVHGHTPTEVPQVRANRLNIDTGAYLSGCLTCAVLEGHGVRFLATGRQFVAADVGMAR